MELLQIKYRNLMVVYFHLLPSLMLLSYIIHVSHVYYRCIIIHLSQVAQRWRICLPVQKPLEVWVPSLGQDDPLEEEMATHSILVWKILWTEEPGGLQSVESQSQIPEATKHSCTYIVIIFALNSHISYKEI